MAGGRGTRLLPATKITNKHLIPIGSTPMIEFPLRVLKKCGIEDILLISGGEHVGDFAEYLGDGSEFEVSLTYRIQKEAAGIAHALLQAEKFFSGTPVVAILGDNVFDDKNFSKLDAAGFTDNAQILLKKVSDPRRFGVAKFGSKQKLIGIVEKPVRPPSEYAVTGFYRYPADVFDIIRKLKPSKRGELEISDVNNFYIRSGRIEHEFFNGFWSDAGTPDSLFRIYPWLKKQNLLK